MRSVRAESRRHPPLRVLVTAGPTREWWDPVRYLSNASSGRMGFEVARAAAARGHRVTLVAGPCERPDPIGVRVVRVESARDMQRAIRAVYPTVDAVVMAAAVSDYRPAGRVRPRKVKKSRRNLVLRLVRNPDLLYDMGREKGNRVLVGFALEDRSPLRNALRKLRKKRLDYVVWNGPEAIGRERASAVVVGRRGPIATFPAASKRRIAEAIVRLLERVRRHPHGASVAKE